MVDWGIGGSGVGLKGRRRSRQEIVGGNQRPFLFFSSLLFSPMRPTLTLYYVHRNLSNDDALLLLLLIVN